MRTGLFSFSSLLAASSMLSQETAACGAGTGFFAPGRTTRMTAATAMENKKVNFKLFRCYFANWKVFVLQVNNEEPMRKIVVAITGASGSIYARLLLEK